VSGSLGARVQHERAVPGHIVSLVTAIMAARDAQKYVVQSVRSLLGQQGVHLEVVVVDDGSCDGTADLVAAIDDPRVYLIRLDNSVGPSTARNIGIEHASGDLIAVQDSDDISLPGRLRGAAACLELRPEVVAVGGQCIALTSSGHYWRHMRFPTDPEEISKALASRVMTVCHAASMFRRAAFEEVGGYSPDYPRAQDLDLFHRLATLGPIVGLPDDHVIYRHRVLLSYRYWSMTRRFSAAGWVEGPPALSWAQSLRYPASMARRVGAFARTSVRSGRLVELQWGPYLRELGVPPA
jgi:glycosyltransferase involved in cell wall biosynthesis